ncbi:MAG: hypothetical protein ACP5D2_02715 [Candidatus Nanoarchaeia archaeon]
MNKKGAISIIFIAVIVILALLLLYALIPYITALLKILASLVGIYIVVWIVLKLYDAAYNKQATQRMEAGIRKGATKLLGAR